MKAIKIEYPEAWTAVSGSSAEAFARDARMAAALKLFEMGGLTSGQAAQLTGIPRVAFLFACPQWGDPGGLLGCGESGGAIQASGVASRIVCNTGPLIALGLLDRLDLLKSLFSEVLIPETVQRKIWATLRFRAAWFLLNFNRENTGN